METIEIRVKGQNIAVPCSRIEGKPIVATGGFVRVARIYEEDLIEGEPVSNPENLIAQLKASHLRADVFTFAQRPPDLNPKFPYPMESENWAVIPITSFSEWWEARLPQEARKNVRRAEKRGVSVRTVEFCDKLVEDIQKIYNEIPVRKGKPFWHFGKDFQTVKAELSTYLERSEFLGAFLGTELIGFIKMVYVDRVATLFHIIAMNAHHERRPMNALVAKAVEVCEQKRMLYFVYGQYTYGNKKQSSLTEFKRRNGFEQVNFPRYYVPLNIKGTLFVKLRLYRGAGGLLPDPVLRAALSLRSLWCRLRSPAVTNASGSSGVSI